MSMEVTDIKPKPK